MNSDLNIRFSNTYLNNDINRLLCEELKKEKEKYIIKPESFITRKERYEKFGFIFTPTSEKREVWKLNKNELFTDEEEEEEGRKEFNKLLNILKCKVWNVTQLEDELKDKLQICDELIERLKKTDNE